VKRGNAVFAGKCGVLVLLLLWLCAAAWSQQLVPPQEQQQDMVQAIRELKDQVRELRQAVDDMRAEAAQYRAETSELRRELETSRTQVANALPAAESATREAPATNDSAAPSSQNVLEKRVAALEDSTQLLNSKVDDQYQTKVSSGSKYRVRLSGIALVNVFSNRGNVDNQDFPTWADTRGPLDSKGSFGATLRQSELGFEVFGPDVFGAKTSGNIQVDFAGGFPEVPDGVNFGLLRLRIADMRLDWDRTALVMGQDNIFISPLSPTSFASLATPALSYAGNLWGWIPQVRLEHRFDISEKQSVTVQGGIIDNLVGQQPAYSYFRDPQAGERTGQPAYGTRIAWTGNIFGEPVTLSAAGYYSRQDWGLNRHVDGWAGLSDWQITLSSRFALSGEFYRGRAASGLGASFAQGVLFNGNPSLASTSIRALDSIGGWSQLKFKATPKLEFNGAYGLDSPFAREVRSFINPNYASGYLQRNQGALVNFVYRPKSDLLLSGEYRHLRTFYADNSNPQADQVNMTMGILF
jgi:regulator of replication initiation timing